MILSLITWNSLRKERNQKKISMSNTTIKDKDYCDRINKAIENEVEN